MARNVVKTVRAGTLRVSSRARTRRQSGKKPSWLMSSRGYLDVIDGGAKIAAAVLTAPVLRGWYSRWGATPAEVSAPMPGDELVPQPKIASTRAITIGAPPRDVWPWLAQIGRGRGGFYSYDALENLVRCDIHSADRIIPRLQQLPPGDLILLAPAGGPCFRGVHDPAAQHLDFGRRGPEDPNRGPHPGHAGRNGLEMAVGAPPC